jgi:hypothetical protein
MVVAYNLTVIGESGDEYPEARNSAILVLNSSAEIVTTISDLGTDASFVFISENGQYVAVVYGTETAHSIVEKKGFRVYSAVSGALLADIESECSGNAGKQGKLFQYGCGTRYYIFDPDVPAVYKKDLTNEESLSLIGIDDEGFRFGANGNTTVLTYSENFERLW